MQVSSMTPHLWAKIRVIEGGAKGFVRTEALKVCIAMH